MHRFGGNNYMRKNKFLLPLIGTFLLSISGCDGKNVTVQIQCNHDYEYREVDSNYHKEVCKKCGQMKPDSFKGHSFQSTGSNIFVCKDCGFEKDTSNVIWDGDQCTKHTWGEKVVIKEATCTDSGQTQRTCIVCGMKEDPKTIKALGHDWVDDATGGVAPTCENEGSKNQHCSRCGATRMGVEVPALGHDFGDWTIIEGREPTCENDGEEKRVCSWCSKEETREVAALGHKFVVIGDDQPFAEDIVRIYKCENGCGQVFLGFKATDVSEASKERLCFTEDSITGEIGVRFWGRPIGNSMALDTLGNSVYQMIDECVYCSTETGDYFEYIFDLTAAQAEALSTCRCYCDAKPADYLSGDFWAYGSNYNDWTPGYYIDGSDEHVEKNEDGTYVMVEDHARCVKDSAAAGDPLGEDHMVKMGKRVKDYRYVLYVNDEIQDFDPTIKVPVEGSMTNTVRKDYVMPYTFHLKEGTNKIRLCMAGGYISTFYNFTFRPC